MSNGTKVRVVLDIEYDLEGTTLQQLQSMLTQNLEQAIGNGLLSGGRGDIIVESHDLKLVAGNVPDLDEDQLAEYFTDQIGDGGMDLEDIPVRLARYGLMDPLEYQMEMAERMGLDEEPVASVRLKP